jgi:acyl carrier protein phosphodiesterase
MNYLAHCYLSFSKPELIIGNFIADSIQGNRFEGLTEGIIKGINLHRKIDSFTDDHPIYLTSKHRFSKDFGKYSGVLMDMIYDHFLAKNFAHYSQISLQEYCSDLYKFLHTQHAILPEPAKRFYGYMTEHNVLFNYSSIQGIELVLTHLSHRIRHRYQLNEAIPLLLKQYDEIEEEFFIFFDELKAYCKTTNEFMSS